MIKVVLFDMDGTLVPMDQDAFARGYFSALGAHAAKYGYTPRSIIAAVSEGVVGMVKNDGARTNSDLFWAGFFKKYPEFSKSDVSLFDVFYETDFVKLQETVSVNPAAKAVIDRLTARGVRLVLASNPVFPQIAQETRVGWAGIDPAAFCYVTSYENSHFCKPDPRYYTEILNAIGAKPDECLMIGNDAVEDGAAVAAGLKFFLLTDCLLHGDGFDLDSVPHGGYDKLGEFLTELGL